MNIYGLVTAAGLSSRMGAFKPLEDVNGFPLICMTVQSLRNARVDRVCVVTGRRGEEVAATLQSMGVQTVHNDRYAQTDMLTSICLGLAELQDADGIFLLPGDMPLVSAKTLAALRAAAEQSDAAVFFPTCEGRRGHPPLIRKTCFETILRFEGAGGLRAALQAFPGENVPVEDEGVLLDADTPEQLQRLRQLAARQKGLSQARCEALYDEAGLPTHIRAHCGAVAALARQMAEALIRAGEYLDVELCDSGARLHDLCRLSRQHELVGAEFLRARGYEALADIVEVHAGFVGETPSHFDEAAVVCLADKLVRETFPITVQRRYAPALEKFGAESEIGQAIRGSMASCSALLQRYETLTGQHLEPQETE